MKKFKNKKMHLTLICMIGMLSSPFIASFTIKCISELSATATQFSFISQYNEVDNVEPEYGLVSTIYNEDNILSHGYGWQEEIEEESTTQSTQTTQTSPTYDNSGVKPYPENWYNNSGKILQMTYEKYTGDRYFNLDRFGQVLNKTTHSNYLLLQESRLLPEFKIEINSSQPQVLIMHTHTTESFEPYERDFYDSSFNYRTTDPTKNVVMVADEIEKQLENAGIYTIHDTTIHDYPSYNGSYSRSAETVKAILEKYPSIKVVLDIHRDAISKDGNIVQPVVNIDGRNAAQVMIISGCDDGTMNMPNYMENFHLACLLQSQMEEDNPGITRPILFDYRQYNQDLTTGSLLIEVGSHGNTLDQVKYSGELIGKSIAKALLYIT